VSVDALIIAKLKELLEGTAWGVHPDGSFLRVAPGKLVVVGADDQIQQAQCTVDPRPCYIIPGEHLAPTITGGRAANVAGHERYDARVIRIVVNYDVEPDAAVTALDQTIADDRLTIKNCLEYPFNLDLVDGWVSSRVVADTIVQRRDPQGIVAINSLAIELNVEYREILP
jgi:hypothetical protein